MRVQSCVTHVQPCVHACMGARTHACSHLSCSKQALHEARMLKRAVVLVIESRGTNKILILRYTISQHARIQN